MLTEIVAVFCIAWYIFIACVCGIGYICLFLYYRQIPPTSTVLSSKKPQDIPHVTLIRPCKGLEPYLYECLASTFQQDYAQDKIAIHFCVSSRSDPAYEIIEKVVKDHPRRNARIFIEEEDDGLANGDEEESSYRKLLGPNPKIRNMSKAYREAGKNDLIWIIDCNVWVSRGVCGRMVDTLCGFTGEGRLPATPYKLVHHLPVSIDVDGYSLGNDSDGKVTAPLSYDPGTFATHGAVNHPTSLLSTFASLNECGGGRLEELFLSSSHAKMYVAINTVAVAPCIVGKSTMFRRAHLDYLTSQKALEERKCNLLNEAVPSEASTGIDYFSHNICEDHLIGDLLWKSPLPPATEMPTLPRKMRNHGLVYGDLAIQPISSMSVGSYISRRVRWLRVRKFTVPVATLVEPGTESFLCSFMGALGLTTLEATKRWAGDSWGCFCVLWCVSILCWMAVDWTLFLLLHSGRTVETNRVGEDVPAFARPLSTSWEARRKFTTWLLAWVGREALTLPIWTWAIWGGTTVTWREGRYWVGLDMRVHEIKEDKKDTKGIGMNGHASASPNGNVKRNEKERIE